MRKWHVRFGSSQRTFYTWYHAEQFVRALTLNGTECQVQMVEVAR